MCKDDSFLYLLFVKIFCSFAAVSFLFNRIKMTLVISVREINIGEHDILVKTILILILSVMLYVHTLIYTLNLPSLTKKGGPVSSISPNAWEELIKLGVIKD